MYHSKTPDNKKDEIRMDMAEDRHIRILICINSAGMGVNFHGANNIIHYGLGNGHICTTDGTRRTGWIISQ